MNGKTRPVLDLCVVSLLTILLFSGFSDAATFSIDAGDVAGFQSALTAAATNGQDDVINVSAGTFNLSSTLTYETSQAYSLTISGDSAASTILDGGDSVRVMRLDNQTQGNVVLRHMTFQKGRITGDGASGGGISIDSGAGGSVTVEDCVISDNFSDSYAAGAGIAVFGGTVSVENCRIENNTLGATYGDDGAGLYLYLEVDGAQTPSSATVRGNTIANNTIPKAPSGDASRDGGGIFGYLFGSGGSITIENNRISNNSTFYGGGGVFFRIPTEGDCVVRENVFLGNVSGDSTAGYGGGAILLDIADGSADISGNIFYQNHSNGEEAAGGGLMLMLEAGSATIEGNVFQENTSDRHGGGANVYFGQTADNLYILQNLFIGNQADLSEGIGGGLNIGANAALIESVNNTFYGNSASEGGGMAYYAESAGNALGVYNDIYWNNTPGAIVNSGTGAITAQYSDIEGAEAEPFFSTGCVDVEPSFEDASDPGGPDDVIGNDDDGFHLTDDSLCADQGDDGRVPFFLAKDIAGENRIQDSAVDMGAYEGPASSAATSYRYVNPSGCGAFSPCHPSIANAVAAAQKEDVIRITAEYYNENEEWNISTNLTLSGGWNSDFSSRTGMTSIQSVSIAGGRFTLDRIGIGPVNHERRAAVQLVSAMIPPRSLSTRFRPRKRSTAFSSSVIRGKE